mgnify:CR=1 FL=1
MKNFAKIFLLCFLVLSIISINAVYATILSIVASEEYSSLVDNSTFDDGLSGWTLVKGSGGPTSGGLDSGNVCLYVSPSYDASSGKWVFEMKAPISSSELPFMEWLKSPYRGVSFSYWFRLVNDVSEYVSAYAYIEYSYTSSIGGCPFAAIWDGEKYVLVNNILPNARSYENMTMVEDYLFIDPLLIEDTVKLKILEFQREMSYIDSISLFSFDYPSHYKVAQLDNGSPVLWHPEIIKIPSIVINSNGSIVTDKIIWEDYLPYIGQKDDYIILEFSNISKAYDLLLIKADDTIIKLSLEVYVLINDTWSFIGRIIPREIYSWYAIDLDQYEIPYNDSLKMKIRFTAEHKIDFIALTMKAPDRVKLRKLKLFRAVHNRLGNSKYTVKSDDNRYIIILPGDELYLIFKDGEKLKRNYKRGYLLKVRGWYRTLSDEEFARYKDRIKNMDPTVTISSEEIKVKESNTWVQVPVYYGDFPDTLESVYFKIRLESPVQFNAYIDCAFAHFAMQISSSNEAGSAKIVAIVTRVNVQKNTKHNITDIYLCFALIVYSSDGKGIYTAKMSVERTDSDSVGDVRELISFEGVSDIIGYDNAKENATHVAEYNEIRMKETQAISQGLAVIGLLLTVLGIITGEGAIIFGIGSLVISTTSVCRAFLINNTDLIDNNDGDRIIHTQLPTTISANPNEGRVTTKGALSAPVHWITILDYGENKLYVRGYIEFGTIIDTSDVIYIGPPYFELTVSLTILAKL